MKESIAELVKKEAAQSKSEKADNLGSLLSMIEAGKIAYPFLRSGDLVKMAVNSPAPKVDPVTGYIDYPVFTKREDEKCMFGIARALDRLGSNINAMVLDKQRILMVIGPTGSGKSDIADIITEAVEKKAAEIGPFFYCLPKCLVRDNPLKLLGPKARQSFQDHYKIHIEGGLCPDCLETFGDQLHDSEHILDIPVETYQYSASLGIGITRLDAKDTKPLETESWKRINSIVLGASGGVLVISELQKVNSQYLDTTHDFFRGRRHKIGSKVYYPDCFIIALTTTKEWQNFQNPEDNIPLVERTGNVYIPYNTAISKEVEIYKKEIRPFFIEHPKQHLAPKLLEFLGEIAIRSRLKDESQYISGQFSKFAEKKKNITQENFNDSELRMLVKLSLYDGKQIAGFTQEDRRIIEEEGVKKYEALQSAANDTSGRIVAVISPPFMSGKLFTMLNDYAVEGETCLSPLKAARFFQELIDNTADDFLKCRPNLIAWMPTAKHRYETWLAEEVKSAFQLNFEESVKKTIDDYIEDIAIILDGKNPNKMKKNRVTGKLEPLNTKTAETLEDKIHGRTLAPADRSQFRFEVITGDEKTLPYFEAGVRKFVKEDGNKAEAVLIQFPPRQEEDEERYQEVLKKLMDPDRGEDRFCNICAQEALNKVSEIMREKKGIK
ncbi:hypothetical protein HYW46_07180 [Candidatus Daviesbacteria bacterium]|nr:hypothetical protein [Candidatus Daviesbacteria bacterium]